MTAITDSLNQTAVQQAHVPFVDFVSLDFSTGFVRLSTWDRDFTFGGNTYTGIGNSGVGSISEPSDEGALKAGALDLTLRGIPTALTQSISDGTEKYFGRTVLIYRGWLNPSTYQLVADPQGIWSGLMDSIVLSDDAGVSDIIVTCENELNIVTQSIGLMYTAEHQAFIDATDTFYSQMASLQNKKVKWGGNTVYTA